MNTSTATSARDLFFRLADRLQIDACLQAIEQDGKSVILHSVSPGLLDHYSQILVQRLRQRLPQTPTEIFFPTHTEALIERFNALLENVSIDDATHSANPQPPQKLWVVHDASALPEHELKLLTRLLQHLPGARVSALLILNGQAQALRNLDPQGRRLLRWEIEPPTPEQIEQTVQEARQMGREFAALELISRLQAPQPVADKSSTAGPAAPVLQQLTAIPTGSPATPAAAASSSGTSSASTEHPAPSSRRGLKASLIAGLLLLSVGVAAWLHPETLSALTATVSSQSATPAPTAAAQEPASSPLSSPVSDSAPATSASEASATPTGAAPDGSASPTASSASNPASATASTSATVETVQAVATTPAAPTAAPAISTSDTVTELPDLAVRGLSWVRQQDKEVWFLEHSRHTSVQAARKHIASSPLLANARMVPAGRSDDDIAHFLVITGPFRSQERARNFAARHELKTATVHSREALLALTPSTGTAKRRP